MNIWKKITLFFITMMYATTLQANIESNLEKYFYTKFEKIRSAIKYNRDDKEKRYTELRDILVPMFDFRLMAKLSLGKRQWMKMSKAQREKFMQLYEDRMKKSYANKLESFDDEKVKIHSVVIKKNKAVITSSIKTTDKILDVIYKLYKPKKRKEAKDEWLIYDVEIIGISILKADKAQFKDFLRTKSLDDLMISLASQTK